MDPLIRRNDGGRRVSGGRRLWRNGRGLRIQIEGNGFSAGVDAELAEDVPHMGSDGGFVNAQIGADGLLGESLGYASQDLSFAVGEEVHD
jgi:hypothetical protein